MRTFLVTLLLIGALALGAAATPAAAFGSGELPTVDGPGA
jgi:hypothetical protein